jgi:hypothetical protein
MTRWGLIRKGSPLNRFHRLRMENHLPEKIKYPIRIAAPAISQVFDIPGSSADDGDAPAPVGDVL